MAGFKVLTLDDVAQLQLCADELDRIDEGLARLLLEHDEAAPTKVCCRQCDCTGYRQGIPSTVCRNCAHDWDVHRC